MFEPHPAIERPRYLAARDVYGRVTLIDPYGSLVPEVWFATGYAAIAYVVNVAVAAKTPFLLEAAPGELYIAQPSGRLEVLAVPTTTVTIMDSALITAMQDGIPVIARRTGRPLLTLKQLLAMIAVGALLVGGGILGIVGYFT